MFTREEIFRSAEAAGDKTWKARVGQLRNWSIELFDWLGGEASQPTPDPATFPADEAEET